MGVGPLGELQWDPLWDEEDRRPPRRRLSAGVLKPLAWVAAWLWLFVLARIAANAVGAGAGYLIVLLAVGVGAWRLDRAIGMGHWSGDREWRR